MSKEDLPKPHPSYPIIGRAMRELAVGWPISLTKPLPLDGNEGLLIAVDLSQSSVRENRIAVTNENCNIAAKSFEWLNLDGLIELSDHGGSRGATLTKKAADLLNSLPAFHDYQQATNRPDREALVQSLDTEMGQLLGPGFLSWLQGNRSGQA